MFLASSRNRESAIPSRKLRFAVAVSRFPELNDPSLVFVVANAFTADECGLLIDRIEREQPRLTTDGTPRETIRHNYRAVVLDPDLAQTTWERIRHVAPSPLIEMEPVGANECVRFYRYTPGDFFKPHQDTNFMRNAHEQSLLSIVVYLGSDYEGGVLRFPTTNRVVQTPAGTAVVFGHRMIHESTPLIRGTKHAFRSDVMYRRVAAR
jgi:predicted 2-oxoglutarate/Fe(II)-dependent dioxygenase YbiX